MKNKKKNTGKKYVDIRKGYEKITFQRLLTITMVTFVSVVFLVFSMIVVFMSESKIRQNTKDNMTIVMRQFDVYLGNYIANIFQGFKSFESNQNLMQLREVSRKKSSLSYTAGNYIYIKKLQEQFLNANSASVHNVYINFGDGRVWTQAYEQDLLKIQYTYDTWKERFPENRYYWVDADSCRDLIPDPAVGAVLFHLYGGTENSYSGIILIAIRKEFFGNILDTTSLDQKASLNIVTEGGIMHFGNEDAWEVVEKNREYLLNCTVEEDSVNTEVLDGYYFMYEDIDLTGWKLVYNVEESSISNTHYIMRDMMLITVFTIVVAGLFLGWLSKAVSYSLCELTKKVEAKDMLEHEISVHSYAEITTLSNSLEDMRLRINHLLNQVKQEQDSKRRAEIALLQEQIHPHFLYNTLYSIMQLCELRQPEKASKMLSALSTFYRIGLSRGENIITVEEELEHVKNYLYIQHFRYSDLFDYTIDCDPDILECRIPKMSLQPLVENAIYHGIKRAHGFGNICILGGSYDGKHAYLEVHDDGPGMSKERLEEIRARLRENVSENVCENMDENVHENVSGNVCGTVRRNASGNVCDKKEGFGIKNVDSRIKFEFGEGAGVEIESAPRDTCVRIRFTMKEMKTGGEE